MYDAYFNLFLWLMAVGLYFLVGSRGRKSLKEVERLEELQRITLQDKTKQIKTANFAASFFGWICLGIVCWLLWNMRDAFRVFFL